MNYFEIRTIRNIKIERYIELFFYEGKFSNEDQSLSFDWCCKYGEFLSLLDNDLKHEEYLLNGIKDLKVCFFYNKSRGQWEIFKFFSKNIDKELVEKYEKILIKFYSLYNLANIPKAKVMEIAQNIIKLLFRKLYLFIDVTPMSDGGISIFFRDKKEICSAFDIYNSGKIIFNLNNLERGFDFEKIEEDRIEELIENLTEE